MAKEKIPMTRALRVLKEQGVSYRVYQYPYEEKGGSAAAARHLGRDEHGVIKTLVFEDENKSPLLVLMHGDRQVSTKTLARELGVKTISPCDPKKANKYTGYMVGGISPFGTQKNLPVHVEKSILDLPEILINAGKRGMLVEIDPQKLVEILDAKPVEAAL